MKHLRLLGAVWLLTLTAALRAADHLPDDRLAPTLQIVSEGKVELAVRYVERFMEEYPRDARLPKLREELLARRAHELGRAAPGAAAGPTYEAGRKLPPFPRRRAEPGQNFTTETAGIALVWIAPGTFRMSATQGSDDDTVVTLTRGYWLGRTEVTQEQWRGLMAHVPLQCVFRGAERPVERIAWVSAVEFCHKLTERESAAGRLPPGYEYTLPTEAQWEYACRAGTTGSFAGELAQMAWYEDNSGGQTHPVGQKQPNAWGLYDMHGNVAEWCLDGYTSGYPGGSASDPWRDFTGPSAALGRIFRGGAWNYSSGGCRSASRNRAVLTATASSLGFRVALAPVRIVPAATKSSGN